MSPLSWESSLKQTLSQSNRERPLRLAVLGIGHELRGDDGVGLAVAEGLRPLAQENFLVIAAAHAPENHTGYVRQFRPTLVLLIDAAQMNEPPGTIRWLLPPQLTGLSASTHTMPPTMLARFLTAELNCEVALIGVQPQQTSLHNTLSPLVQKAANYITQTICDLWNLESEGRS